MAASEVICPALTHISVHKGAGSLVLLGGEGQVWAQPWGWFLTGEGFPPRVCWHPALEREVSSSPAASSWERFRGGEGTIKLPVPLWEEGLPRSSPRHGSSAFRRINHCWRMGPNEENLKCLYPLKSGPKYSAMEFHICLSKTFRSNVPFLRFLFFSSPFCQPNGLPWEFKFQLSSFGLVNRFQLQRYHGVVGMWVIMLVFGRAE